jgi:hypothetical protein
MNCYNQVSSVSASALASRIKEVKSKVKSHGLKVGSCEILPSFDPVVISASDFLQQTFILILGKQKLRRLQKT